MHRVGRAGRAGRKGASLLLLAPAEDTYVEFLALRKIPLTPYQEWRDLNAWWRRGEVRSEARAGAALSAGGGGGGGGDDDGGLTEGAAEAAAGLEAKAKRLEQRVRQRACTDRDLLERGSRAFMAHLRAYKVSGPVANAPLTKTKHHRFKLLFRNISASSSSGGQASTWEALPTVMRS